MPITWTGSGFSGNTSYVTSQFFDASSNTYLYEQNYQSFFPAIVTDSTATLAGSGIYTPVHIAPNTILTPRPDLASSVSPCETQLLGYKYHQFASDGTNMVDMISGSPGAYIISTITEALSGSNVADALLQLAPYFVNPQLQFSLHDIVNSWPNGVAALETLSNIFQNLQSNTQGVQDSADRIKDFKKKLIRMQAATADEVRKVQGSIEQYSNQGTFTALVSAFPSVFGPINQAIQNSNGILSGQLANYLPSNGVSAVVSTILNNILGGAVKPPIMNAVDKILSDISSLDSDLNNIIENFPTDGFGSLADQTQFVNQISSVIVNELNKIPVVGQAPPIPPLTDLNRIISSISTYSDAQLGQAIASSPSVNNALQKLLTTMSNAASSVINAVVSDVTDPFVGGSFMHLGPLASVFGGEVDESVTPPNITISPDPILGAATQQRNNQQAKANSASVPRNVPRGSGINILDEVPMRSRNIPVDGSKGDYKVISGIEV